MSRYLRRVPWYLWPLVLLWGPVVLARWLWRQAHGCCPQCGWKQVGFGLCSACRFAERFDAEQRRREGVPERKRK